MLYQSAVKPMVDPFLEGFNSCVFAYGQTGCGVLEFGFGDWKSIHQKYKIQLKKCRNP